MRRLAPTLLAVPGCGVLSAATLFAETAGARRFRSKDAYARFTGTAPIPVCGTAGKLRLNRGGNRTANCALHMIALTQTRGIGPGAATSRTHRRRQDPHRGAPAAAPASVRCRLRSPTAGRTASSRALGAGHEQHRARSDRGGLT
jgi:transposase